MTKYNILNVKSSNSQLNKLKYGIRKWNSSNFGSSIKLTGKTNFTHKLFLIDTQVSNICKAFANGLLTNIKF